MLISACVTTPSVPQQAKLAILAAEQFVKDQGYTVEPVSEIQRAEIFDQLKSLEQIKKERAGALESVATGFDDLGNNSFYVVFPTRNDKSNVRRVLVQAGVPVQVLHDIVPAKSIRFVKTR